MPIQNVTDQDYYNFHLKFKGSLIENSVDAYDVANTIIATSNIIQEISEIRYGSEASDQLRINIHAFEKGSLDTSFLIHSAGAIGAAVAPLLPYANGIYAAGKEVLNIFKTYIEIRKALKGDQPAEIASIGGNKFNIKAKNSPISITVNNYDLRVLQSKDIGKNTERAMQPLNKPDSLIEEMDYLPDGLEPMNVSKEDAQYFLFRETMQTLDKVKYKGFISKIDTKAQSGYINIGSTRLPFNYSQSLPQEKFELLVESLKTKIQVFVIGSVSMDYESHPKQMIVNDVESEFKLFE